MFYKKPIYALHGQKDGAKDNNVYDRKLVQFPEPLQRLRSFEMAGRDLNSIRFQLLKESGANASCSEGTMDAVLIGILFNEPIDFLHLDNVSLHPGNFADAHCPPLPIGKPLELDNDAYC